jgi:hypothetical protein
MKSTPPPAPAPAIEPEPNAVDQGDPTPYLMGGWGGGPGCGGVIEYEDADEKTKKLFDEVHSRR